MKQKTELYRWMMKIGASSGCHQRADRSFHIRGLQFPLCARCTGILLGYILGWLTVLVIPIPAQINFVFVLVMFFDWNLQYTGICESTNTRRFISGLLYGVAFDNIVVWILRLSRSFI